MMLCNMAESESSDFPQQFQRCRNDDGFKSCSRSPCSSMCWSPKRCVTNFVLGSAVDRVPRSLSLSSEGIQGWYALIASAREYDRECRICVELHSGQNGSIQIHARCPDCRTEKLSDASTTLRPSQPAHAQNHGACLQHGNGFTKNATIPF